MKLIWKILLAAGVLAALTACGAENTESTVPETAETALTETTQPAETTEMIETEPRLSHKEYLAFIREALPQEGEVISAGFHTALAITPDGKALYWGEEVVENHSDRVEDWDNLVQVSSDNQLFSLGLRKDGTMVNTGNNSPYDHYGQDKVEGWTDIQSFDADRYLTVGLRKDGTVIVAGQGAVPLDWEDIQKVVANGSAIYAINKFGRIWTYALYPVDYPQEEYHKIALLQWDELVDLECYDYCMVGLRRDGTVQTSGLLNSDYDAKEFIYAPQLNWTDIVQISMGAGGTICGLCADGTVKLFDPLKEREFPFDEVSQWEDIVSISVGTHAILGLKADGSVVACGYPEELCQEVSTWKLAPTEVPRK